MNKRGDELGELAPLLRAAQSLDELSGGERARVKARIRGSLRRPVGAPRILRFSRVVAAVSFVLMGAGAISAAARYGIVPWIPGPGRPAPSSGAVSPEPAPRPRRPATVKSSPTPASQIESAPTVPSEPPQVPPAAEPAVAPAPARVPARTLARASLEPTWPAATPLSAPVSSASPLAPAAFAPTHPTAPSPSVAPTPVAPATIDSDEHIALGRALRRLRHDHDAEGALAILGDVARAHPGSNLALERSNLEVEALLSLGRDDQALARLDGMALDRLPRGAERYVVRGELRARAQRWAEARADFQHALAQASGQPAWRERALWGRAVAGLRLSDRAGAQDDLRRYLELYPAGGHATEATRLLSTP